MFAAKERKSKLTVFSATQNLGVSLASWRPGCGGCCVGELEPCRSAVLCAPSLTGLDEDDTFLALFARSLGIPPRTCPCCALNAGIRASSRDGCVRRGVNISELKTTNNALGALSVGHKALSALSWLAR